MWVELESSSVNFLKSLLNFSFMNICSKKHSLHILQFQLQSNLLTSFDI